VVILQEGSAGGGEQRAYMRFARDFQAALAGESPSLRVRLEVPGLRLNVESCLGRL
jgi:hypothetical protein